MTFSQTHGEYALIHSRYMWCGVACPLASTTQNFSNHKYTYDENNEI